MSQERSAKSPSHQAVTCEIWITSLPGVMLLCLSLDSTNCVGFKSGVQKVYLLGLSLSLVCVWGFIGRIRSYFGIMLSSGELREVGPKLQNFSC